MKKSLLMLMCLFALIMSSGFSSMKDVESTLSVTFLDENKESATVEVKAKIKEVDSKKFISLTTLHDINSAAEIFVTYISYSKYDGYMILNFINNNRVITTTADDVNYTVYDGEYVPILRGKFSAAPFQYEDEYYIPLEFISLSSFPVTINKDNIKIDFTKKITDAPVITDFDLVDQVFIVTQKGEALRYKLIGVKFPKNEKEFDKYSLDYIMSLFGKEVSLWFDKSMKSGDKYDKKTESYNVYAYELGSKVSINEDILKKGHATYFNQANSNDLNTKLQEAALYAKTNKLGIYKDKEEEVVLMKSNEYKVISVSEKTKYVQSHGLGDTVYTERKVVLEQNGKIIVVDFMDTDLPVILDDMISISLKKLESQVGKVVTFKNMQGTDQYSLQISVMSYALNK